MIEINQLEEVNEDSVSKLIVDLIISGKINCKVYFVKNTEGNLCAYINKDVNNEIIKGINLAFDNSGFGFMANMFFQMYQPVEINYDCDSKKFIEILLNSKPHDVNQYNNNTDKEINSLKELILSFDESFNLDNVPKNTLNNENNDVEQLDIMKMLTGQIDQLNLDNSVSDDDETGDNDDETGDNEDETSDNSGETDDEVKSEIKNTVEENNNSNNLNNLMEKINPDLLNSVFGNLGKLMETNQNSSSGLDIKTNPADILSNIKNMWTNEYYDAKDQEDLEDFLIKDEESEENPNEENPNEENPNDLPNVTDDLDFKNLFNNILGINNPVNRKTKYLEREVNDTALEILVNITEDKINHYLDLADKFKSKEQYDDLISEYKNIIIKNTDDNLKKNIIQEIRVNEDGLEYIYSKFNYYNKNIEFKLDHQLVCKYLDIIIKILSFAKNK